MRHSRSLLRRVSACVIGVGAICLSAWNADAQCVRIDGGKITIKPAAGNKRSKLTWKAKDRSLSFLIADPTRGTTTVSFAAGAASVSLTYDEDSAPAWRASGDPVKQWKYKDRDDPSPVAGITKIKSRKDRFIIKGAEGIVDTIGAPLPLPLIARVTDSTGACFEAVFSTCQRNDMKKIRCESDAPVCVGALPGAVGADRLVNLDVATTTPYPDPNPLRSACLAQLTFPVGTPADQMAVIDQTFDTMASTGSPRRIRPELRQSHWPELGFNNATDCEWAGVVAGTEQEPRLDQAIRELVSSGDEVLLRMNGSPAFLSSDCSTATCAAANLMSPDGSTCTCNASGFSRFPPAAYNQAFTDFWGCALKHYALLGVRKFEIWNEPDVAQFFEGNPANPLQDQKEFIEMFENIRLALEQRRATDPDLAAFSSDIQIGGPAVSSFDNSVGGAPTLLPALLSKVDQNGGELDFVSLHMYVADPGAPFAQDVIGQVRNWIPAGWGQTPIVVDEWQTALGDHACQIEADGVTAQAAGVDASVNCDHRGAGYAAYMMAGFMAAGSDVDPYVFEMFERNDLAPNDFFRAGMGLVTAHGLPKPEALAMWGASQMRGTLLGAEMETSTDRSFGWVAARDENDVVHVLIGHFDSDGEMHFTRTYTAAGFAIEDLIAACGCSGAGGQTQQNICLRDVLQTVTDSNDRPTTLTALCAGLSAAEQAAVLSGIIASEQREPLVGQAMSASIGVAGLPCADHDVDLYEIGPGTTTTEVFRSQHTVGEFCALCDDQNAQNGPGCAGCEEGGWCPVCVSPFTDAEWLTQASDLWALAKTPTQSFTVSAGASIPPITIPAYGAVYLQIR